jgi:hypothetical protein
VAYLGKRLDHTDYEAIFTRAERFAHWAKESGNQLKISGGIMAHSEDMQLGRAKNAVLDFLEQSLSIPKIYIDAEWDGHRVDVLAINRDGVGDVHVVLLFPRAYFDDGSFDMVRHAKAIEGLIERFQEIPAQYKYVAAVETKNLNGAPFGVSAGLMDRSFSPDGIGRVGFITVDAPLEGAPQVKIEVKPERFRAKIAKLADEYVQQHEADWEIRA